VALAAAGQAGAAARDGAKRLAPSARAAILVDGRDGRTLYERNADAHRPIASTTKLMTALLAIEKLPLGRRIAAAPYRPAPVESQLGLEPGERMSVADLLRALLLPSANDAAATLARGAAGSVRRFVRMMNRRAAALGLRDTHFANPIGLDEPGNYSSARDLARLARAVLRNRFLAETVDMPRARLLSGAHQRVISNRNDLVGRVPFVDGVKTGHTADAGYVLVGAATRRGGIRLVSVVLGTPSERARDADTLSLLRHGLGLFRRVDALSPARAVAEAKVAFFGDRRAAIRPARAVVVGVRRDQRVRTRIDAPGELHGPLPRGARVGSATVYLDGRRLRTVPLVTAGSVPAAGFPRKLAHWVFRPLALVPLALLAVLVAERRRRRLAAADAARRRRRRAARLD